MILKELKIIAYSFFPNLRNIIKIDDENWFYRKEKDHIIIYIKYLFIFKYNEKFFIQI